MKASELRIGNYVYDGSPLNETIVIKAISQKSGYVDWVKPIPLTEDWLLKFGFVKKLNSSYNIYKLEYGTNQTISLIESKMFYFPTLIDDNQDKIFSLRGIKHVHQLQNLYFALTGEELEIKKYATH